jgi:hypothetical protein
VEIQRGLGRGLGALFPSAQPGEAGSSAQPGEAGSSAQPGAAGASAPSPPDERGPSTETVTATGDLGLVVQDVIYAGLDSLLAAMPLDLCAYLHLTEGSGPQLYLRTPDLSSMDANECFALFGALRDAIEADGDDAPLDVRGFHALSINTPGAHSRGLHVVGRRAGELDDHERVLAGRLCHALGAATHALEASAPSAGEPALRLSVEVVEGGPQADITLEAGGQTRTGRGTAESPFEAVALAVLDAYRGQCRLVHAGLQDAGHERVALVIVEGDGGDRALGSALGQDPLHATASAALEAVRRHREAGARADRDRQTGPAAGPT